MSVLTTVSCTPRGTAGIVIPLLSILLVSRGIWLIAKGRSWGLGLRGRILQAADRFPLGILATVLLVGGWGSLLVSRLVYVFGNPGGAAPQLVFIVLSLLMAAGFGAILFPLFRGKAYTLRMSWYSLGALALFLFFFSTVQTPCGTMAAGFVFYGITVAFAGTVLRLWHLLGASAE